MSIFTFHDIVAGCPRRDLRAWQEFASRYLPISRQLLTHYLPASPAGLDQLAGQVLRSTLENDGAFFSSFSGRSEREFMVHYRQFAIDRGLEAAPPAASDVPVISLETLEEALRDMPALQRMQVWLMLLAYTPAQAAPMLNAQAASLEETLRTAQDKLRSVMDVWSEDSLRASAVSLVASLQGRETKDCYPHNVFHRVIDGQVTWREREEVLNHVGRCFNCVHRFSTIQEMVLHWRTVQPATAEEVRTALAPMGLMETEAPKKKRFFARLFK